MSERRFAVLAASSQYPNEPKLQDLRCPENDVDGLNEILASKVHGEFTETFVLKNRPHHEVLLKINQVLRQASKDDLVLIYYSGHGKLDPAGRLHLATINTAVDALEASSIPVESIRNYVDISSSTKVVLILDCCFSGAVDKAFLRSSVDDQLQLASGGRGTFIMTASTGIQVAQEKETDQYGIFTKHLIEGIRGGEADLNDDGIVSMEELYRYVHNRVLEEGFQEPMKWDFNVRGELAIARTGKVPQENRRRQIKEILLTLAGQGGLPDSILLKGMEVIALEPAKRSGKLHSYDVLLEQLLEKRIVVGEFIERWFKVDVEPSLPESEERIAPAQARPSHAKQQPTPKLQPASVDLPLATTVLKRLILVQLVGFIGGLVGSLLYVNPGYNRLGAYSIGAIWPILSLTGAVIGWISKHYGVRIGVIFGWYTAVVNILFWLFYCDMLFQTYFGSYQ